MNLSHDDPRLTAYVLGELDEADCREIERAIESSPQLQRTIAEIRTVADALTQQLKVESTPQLDRVRRAEIESALNGRSSAPAGVERAANFSARDPEPAENAGSRRLKPATRARRVLVPLSLAASVALVFGITHYGLPELSRARELSPSLVAKFQKSGEPSRTPTPAEMVANARRRGSTAAATPGERAALNAAPAPQSAAPQSLRRVRTVIAPGEGGIRAALPVGPPMTEERKKQLAASQGKSISQEFGLAAAPSPAAVAALQGLGYTGGAAPQDASISRSNKVLRDREHFVYRVDFRGNDALSPELQEFIFQECIASNDPYRCVRFDWTNKGEAYNPVSENPFLAVLRDPLSTFSIDVDTASYSNVRRFLQQGTLPPRDAVRIEELINYFDYDYPLPTDEHPFSVNVEVAECPWAPDHRLARIGIKGMEFSERDRPAANLVFLIDVSGSMNQPNKLPLVKESLELLVNQLRRDDSVAMVVYAGASGLVLPPTGGGNRDAILDAIDRLQSGGSTNAGAGIQLAYDTAIDHFVEGGVNRVILATDGDFNVGIQNREELQRLIEEKAKSGVFLSVLGYGMGNLKDGTLELLADKGNGNYAYIDTINEAQKVLVDQMGGTLVTIAKDVKIQVEFNPAEVSSYRLIGYENRMLAAQDFNDDRKDAGEIGAGHTVTALYEIVPAGVEPPDDAPLVDALKYQIPATQPRSHEATRGDEDQYRDREGAGFDDEQGTEDEEEIDNRQSTIANRLAPAAESGELMTVKLRYKEPDEDVSKLIEVPVTDSGAAFADSSDDFAFAASVASFGMLLRQSSYAKLHGANPAEAIDLFDYDFVREVAADARGTDPFGYRAEFLQLVERAKSLSAPAP